jgi:hypothetical protein
MSALGWPPPGPHGPRNAPPGGRSTPRSVPGLEAGQLLPDGNQRLLERILGAVAIPGHADRDRVQPIRRQSRQRSERFCVARLCGCHQFGLHHAVPSPHRLTWPLLLGMRRTRARFFNHGLFG